MVVVVGLMLPCAPTEGVIVTSGASAMPRNAVFPAAVAMRLGVTMALLNAPLIWRSRKPGARSSP